MPAAKKAPAGPLVESGEVPLLFLDANILLTQYLRSVVLDLADAGLCRVHWTDQVMAEVRRNLLKPKFRKTPEQADGLIAAINEAFPDALVQGWEALETDFAGKTDPKDAHVAAGALRLSRAVYGGQKVLLTSSNLKHLPQAAFAGTNVRPARPGPVLKDLLAAEPAVAQVLDDMLTRFKAPPVTKKDLLEVLDRSGCAVFATALGRAWGFGRE